MKKKVISILLTIVMLIGIIPFGSIGAFAAEGVKYLEYNTETGAFDELTCTNYTPLADDVTEWTDGWYVAPAEKLELGEVNVSGSVYLILTDGCELIIDGGICVNEGNSLTIFAQSEDENMGSLTANGMDFSAGIGSEMYCISGNITICGGKITANGGTYGAGIGSGGFGNCGNITICGGNIAASGGGNGAGIGGGHNGNGGNITIYDGIVTANSGGNGAGIGGGHEGDGGNITIYDGTVKATGGYEGIQSAITFPDQVIIQNRLSGKPVIVDSNETWRNIFKNKSVFVDIINLNCKLKDCTTVTSDTNEWTSGWYSVSGRVTINSPVTVTGDVHLILMGGCDLTVNGGIRVENENSLSVYSLPDGKKPGSLTANGSKNTAGIGSGEQTNSGQITICGGTVKANGGKYGAGIGGGHQSTGGHITICDGTVTAIGGYNAAGIGGYTNGYLTVTGGQVNATGGEGAAGIGGHYNSHGINITVTGGSVIAKAGREYILVQTGEIKKGNAIGYGGNNEDNGKFLKSEGVTLYRPDGSVVPYNTHLGTDYYKSYIDGDSSSFGDADEVAFFARSENYSIPYSEFNTKNNKFETKYASNPIPLFLLNENTSWSAPWYVAENDVTIDSTVIVKGDVNLILKDGCKLEAKGGIAVNEGNSLTIYAQSNGDDMGELIAEGTSFSIFNIPVLGNAAIGGCSIGDNPNTYAGDITIHGGKITAIGKDGGAGIGGTCGVKSDSPFGFNLTSKCGNIIIYGGDITAEATDGSAAIGVGRAGEGGSISIYSKAKIHAVSDGAEGIKADAVTVYPNSTHDIIHIKQNDSDIEGSPFTQTTVIGSLLSQGNVDVIPETVHSFTGKYIDNCDGTHSQKCAYCDEFGTPENHTFVNHICACGATNEHSFTGSYVNNGDGTHSRKCTGCEKLDTPEEHTFENYTCVCGAHNWGKYIDRKWDEETEKVISEEKDIPANAEEITANTTTLLGGWYVVSGTVTNENRIVIRGTDNSPTNIVLLDGAVLNATIGIELAKSALNIYAQNNDTGKIEARSSSNNNAAIGGNAGEIGGNLTVNGGTVTAISSTHGAGIGGGGYSSMTEINGADGGTVIVNGGAVTATSTYGAGIGGGNGLSSRDGIGGACGIVIVNGGTVTATSSKVAGIGRGANNTTGKFSLAVADNMVIKAGYSADNVSVVTLDNYKGHIYPYVYITPGHTHNFTGEYVSNGDGTHSRKCTGCDELGEPENHTYKDGVCDKCGAGIITLKNGAVSENGFIFGLAPKLTSLTDYIDVAEGCELEYCTDTIGTGTEINAVKDSISYTSLTVVIFGDVNGDGVYDGMDAMIVNCLVNGMLTREQVGEAVYMAADCNHDGAIDSLDVDILKQAGVLLASVDQSKPQEELQTDSAYVEYLNLIDQNPVNEETEPKQTPSALEKLIGFIADIYAFLNNLINFIKTIFA